MLYQILIEVTNIPGANNNLTLFEFNKEEKEYVIEEVVIPYLNKEDFQFNGYFLEANNIVRIVVKTTEEPVQDIVKRLNAANPPGYFIYTNKEAIVIGDKHTKDVTKEIFAEAKSITSERNIDKITSSETTELDTAQIDRTKVFIVHGHDEVVKISVARFLERLNLKPIILHEQASSGRTIIEKIEEYSNVGFGIVLYTPCDIGMSKEAANPNDLKQRARQNVVFEHGYLLAKIGRDNVCALVKDDIEKPNDISGIVYVDYDSGGGWHMELVKELISSGYDIDTNLLFK